MSFFMLVMLLSPALQSRPTSDASAEIQRIGIRSEAVGRALVYGVLPPQGKSAARVPVIFLLHGLGDNWTRWAERGVLTGPWRSDVLLVFVDAGNSWYFDWPDAPDGQKNRWETYVVQELIPDVERRFGSDPRRRALLGFSMGGHGAATLALRHADMFVAAACLSGPMELTREMRRKLAAGESIQDAHRERLSREEQAAIGAPGFSSDEQRTPRSPLPEHVAFWLGHDPFELGGKLARRSAPRLYIASGIDDDMLGQSKRFAAHLKERGLRVEFEEMPGGHDRAFLRLAVPRALTRLAQELRGGE